MRHGGLFRVTVKQDWSCEKKNRSIQEKLTFAKTGVSREGNGGNIFFKQR